MKTNIDRMEITKMKTLDMTKGSPIRLILQFTVPLLIGAVFQQFYNFTDTMRGLQKVLIILAIVIGSAAGFL